MTSNYLQIKFHFLLIELSLRTSASEQKFVLGSFNVL